MTSIIIVDFDGGNVRSATRAIEHLGYSPKISGDPKEIEACDILVLPGQGAFPKTMDKLQEQNLIDPIKAHIQNNKPYLGICVGFQILFETSYENGVHKGLGLYPGEVVSFDNQTLKVPHMGWNSCDVKQDTVFKAPSPQVYFVHSYYVPETDDNITATTTTYGETTFVSAIQTPTLLGTQFHIEKSGEVGLDLLKNFFQLVTG